ncbi:MAG: non-heme iron oxygenase ferredoxin subunit [Candidatus Aenigmatarchaeota archaeon]
MNFVKAGLAEMKDGEIKNFKLNRKEILISKINGEYYAVDNECTHMGCSLSEGTVKGNKIECPCHGSVFDLKTGKVIRGPANKPATVFDIKVYKGKLMVNL